VILDTNVFSELMRPAPASAVLDWFLEPRVLYVTAITRAELMLGVAMLPAGKRKTGLSQVLEEMFETQFQARCLAFDSAAADAFAELRARRTRQARAISTEDAQIAAIALVQGLPLATRSVKDFWGIARLELVNPWA
jgi:toxin FitB